MDFLYVIIYNSKFPVSFKKHGQLRLTPKSGLTSIGPIGSPSQCNLLSVESEGAKSTSSYFLGPTYLGIIMSLSTFFLSGIYHF